MPHKELTKFSELWFQEWLPAGQTCGKTRSLSAPFQEVLGFPAFSFSSLAFGSLGLQFCREERDSEHGSEVPSALGVSLLHILPAEESDLVTDLPDSQSSSIKALAWPLAMC